MYRSHHKTQLTEQWIKKISAICEMCPSAVYHPKTNKLVIEDQTTFYQVVYVEDGRSRRLFDKQLKSLGYRRHQKNNNVVFKWKHAKMNKDLSDELLNVCQLVNQNIQTHSTISEQIRMAKQSIDNQMEILIFKLLMSDKSTHSNLINKMAKQIQDTMNTTLNKTIQTVENIQSLYNKQLSMYITAAQIP